MRSLHRFRTRTAALTLTTALAAATALVGAPSAQALPGIPDLTEQYWFGNMRISQVWDLGATGQGMTVAVLDTGVQAAQPELAGVVLPGTDFAGGDGRTDTDTDVGHGSSMARLIAGQGGGRNDLTGIAPSAKILPVVVDDEKSPVDFTAAVSKGIRYAVDHKARIINLSQAKSAGDEPGNCPTAVADAVRYAIGRGAVVVAGAGNDGASGNAPKYPAACPGVLAVGAVDGSKRPWSGTERQSYVDVASAGVHLADENLAGEAGYSDGTSNATALVSGALALVWSKLPTLTNRQVVARILATLTDDAASPGRDDATGYGIVRPYFAITQKVSADAPNPVFDEIKSTSPSGSPSGTSSGTSSGPAGSSPTASGATTPGSGPRAADSGSSSIGLYLGLAGAVIVIAALVIVLLVVRGRRGPGAPGGYPGPPAGPPGSGW